MLGLMLSKGAYSFWMIFPFVWGMIGVLIIGVACIRELIRIGNRAIHHE